MVESRKLNKSRTKVTQLLSFLDEIEDETEKELAESKCGSMCSFVVHDCPSEASDMKSEFSVGRKSEMSAGSTILSSFKEKMVTQKVQLEDYSRTIQVLKKALEQSQRKQREMQSDHEQELKAKLTKLRKEEEIATARHLGFVDRLLADKDSLSQECASLGRRMAEIEMQSRKHLEHLREEHTRILKQEKDKWTVVEKKKRNAWIARKTKDIKEATIKSLEPEMQLLFENHKRDLEKREELHASEICEMKRKFRAESEDAIAELRCELSQRREDLLKKERAQFEERLTAKTEEYARKLSEQQKKVQNHIDIERQRTSDEHRAARERWQDSMDALKARQKQSLKALEQSYAMEREDLNAKHLREFSQREEDLQREKDTFQENLKREFNEQMQAREKEVHERVQSRQQKEIEIVVEKIVRDAHEKTAKLEKQHDLILADLKSRQKENLKAEEKKRKEVESRLKSMQARLALAMAESQKHLGSLKEARANVLLAEKRGEACSEEAENARAAVRSAEAGESEESQRLRERIRMLEKAIREQEEDRVRLLENFEREREQIESHKLAELDQVEARVRQALCRKDEIMSQLREQLEAKEIRIRQTERLLECRAEDLVTELL